MLILFLFLLIWGGISTTLSIFVLASWWIILWIFLGLLGATLLFILSILFISLLFKIDKKHNRPWKYKVLYHYFSFVMRILRVKMTVEGKENIPSHPFVVYSNHKSMLDVIAIFIAYKTILSAVSKSSVYKVPIIKHFMKSCAVISIDRENDREGVRELLRGIKLTSEGFSYIIFPEGGIKSRDIETMVSLKPGAYKLATKANANISPVSIIGSSKIAKRSPFKKTKIKLLIHKQIAKEEYDNINTTELGEHVADIINKGILTGKIDV